MEKILLSPPHMSGKEIKYVEEAIRSNWVVPLGPFVTSFEKELNQYMGENKYFSVATNTGTAAIHVALTRLGIGPGDEVFCSSLTFVASANPILYLKAVPVFIDSESKTWNMSPSVLEHALCKRAKTKKLPKAVIIVDLFGMSADFEPLIKICDQFNVPIIEDAAEALGSQYRNRPCGSFGKFGILSFNGNKIITTSSGGAIITQSHEEAKIILKLITQSREDFPFYQHSQMGFNYRMSNICAAIGKAQLEVLEKRTMARRDIFNFYHEGLSDIAEIQFLKEDNKYFSNRWLSTFLISSGCKKKPNDLVEYLKANNIEARHVWKPMHLQPLFQKCDYFYITSDISKDIFQRGVCLPSGSRMTREQIEFVIEKIKHFFKN